MRFHLLSLFILAFIVSQFLPWIFVVFLALNHCQEINNIFLGVVKWFLETCLKMLSMVSKALHYLALGYNWSHLFSDHVSLLLFNMFPCLVLCTCFFFFLFLLIILLIISKAARQRLGYAASVSNSQGWIGVKTRVLELNPGKRDPTTWTITFHLLGHTLVRS